MSDVGFELEFLGDPNAGQCIDGVCTIPNTTQESDPANDPSATGDHLEQGS